MYYTQEQIDRANQADLVSFLQGRGEQLTRAGQEYRQVDPRPHNVVSDFTIKLGVGMQFPQYVLGLDLQGRLYKQDQDIDFFYPPGASSSELYMTGLGSYYTRYSLNSESFNIGYDGKGCLLAAQLMPRHAKGWYARAAFESLTTERLNKSNNTVPITRLKTRQATLSAAYRSGRWSLRAGGGYELRRSIEMIADRTGHSVIVDEQAMYKNRIWHADAEATVEWRRGTVNYMLSPRAEWRQSTATSYTSPSVTRTSLPWVWFFWKWRPRSTPRVERLWLSCTNSRSMPAAANWSFW